MKKKKPGKKRQKKPCSFCQNRKTQKNLNNKKYMQKKVRTGRPHCVPGLDQVHHAVREAQTAGGLHGAVQELDGCGVRGALRGEGRPDGASEYTAHPTFVRRDSATFLSTATSRRVYSACWQDASSVQEPPKWNLSIVFSKNDRYICVTQLSNNAQKRNQNITFLLFFHTSFDSLTIKTLSPE